MTRIVVVGLLMIACLFVFLHTVQGKPAGRDEKIRSAMSAAPASIARGATILDFPAKEGQQPPVLRKGSTAWTCFPNDPSTPGNDPICLDRTWLKWFGAYLTKTKPDPAGVGVAYMLRGGSDVSNHDPFARPASSKEFIPSPPHIMVIGPGKLDRTIYGTDHHSGRPWIMWAGTPYEHLMVPTGGR
jgi:hypothetical protein